ncbi:nucleoside deoxyribosyltransferase [Bifidobacterium sp. DSM 109958]|uniref:Nucleoside deoxyribosyltransferase n=1 Tax=Bifidobacterium moraviense TaxID=2675323 RepID=A0A7Y0F0C9_9BIFI|nr:nucleoside 2-deoxyribosyltransferase [Bifidobacterium sp. DSM 109958]NMM99508.1 nucleoside deoxyribosyltransferase [Bifidobacterium sp. DSM 109958]
MDDALYDFYVAGPFFDRDETASMERLEAVLDAHGLTTFKPRFASEIEEVGPKGCFDDDVAAIRRSKAVIANLMDDDPGTMFEIGFAHALGLPVYAYREGLAPTDRVNLMIGQAVRAVFAGPDDLARWLETGEHRDVDYIQF